MDLEMVLNELSFRSSAKDEETARQHMTGLLDTIRAATVHGVKRNLHIDRNISLPGLELASGYPVARWLNDGLVNRDLRNYFRSLSAKSDPWQAGNRLTEICATISDLWRLNCLISMICQNTCIRKSRREDWVSPS